MTDIKGIANSNALIVIGFIAEWSGASKFIPNQLNQLTNKFGDKITTTLVDIDKEPAIAGDYKVRNVPTILFIKDGSTVAKQVGVTTLDRLIQLVYDHI